MYKIPLISICIPVYNGEKYLNETINSCLRQDYLNYEIIICNNNSSDNTIEVIRLIKSKKIKVINNLYKITAQENFNKVISYASGKYFILLPHDDLLETRALSVLSAALEINECASFAFGSSRRIDDQSNEISLNIKDNSGYYEGIHALNFILKDFPPFQHVLVRKSSINSESMYKQYYGSYADVYLYTRLTFNCGGFEVLNLVCSSIRERSDQGQAIVHYLSRNKYEDVRDHHGHHSYFMLQLRGNVNLSIMRYIKYIFYIINTNKWNEEIATPLLVNIYSKNLLGQIKVCIFNKDLFLLKILLINFKYAASIFSYKLMIRSIINNLFVKLFNK
jgi:glycosyltransferase involved in cell wall biosynthesis